MIQQCPATHLHYNVTGGRSLVFCSSRVENLQWCRNAETGRKLLKNSTFVNGVCSAV